VWIDMPPKDDEVSWKVYRYSSTKKFQHYSLFFKCEPYYKYRMGFTFELLVFDEKVLPVTQVIDVPEKKYLHEHGTVRMSAKAIMETGMTSLEKFGNYNFLKSNCQHFCSKLAKDLGLRRVFTDTDGSRQIREKNASKAEEKKEKLQRSVQE